MKYSSIEHKKSACPHGTSAFAGKTGPCVMMDQPFALMIGVMIHFFTSGTAANPA